MTYRQGRQSAINIWQTREDQDDRQVAMARTDWDAAELVRLANLGAQLELEERKPEPTGADYTLDISTEIIDVTNYGPRRDPDWAFTDTAGHTHTWDSGTWHSVQDDPDEPAFYFDADGEEYNADTHIECKTCGEHLHPGMLEPTGWHEHIPGRVTATLTGQRSDGTTGTAVLTDAEQKAIQSAGEDRDRVVQQILDALPGDRIIASGDTAGGGG